MLATFCVALSVGVAVAQPADATGAKVAAPAAAPLTYTVQAGDYLSGIAAKLGVSLTKLLTTNQLSSTSLIYPGMKLIVPAGGALPAPAAPAPGTPLVYTVRPGDYLGGIASKMGVTLSKLLTTNQLTLTSVIHPGSQLKVPTGGHLPTGSVTTPAPTPAPAHGGNASAPLVYVVRSGDYLSGIAPRLGVRLSDLLATNKLTLTSLIYPGLRLVVPAGGHLPTAPAAPAAPAPGAPATNARVGTVLAFAQAQLGKPYLFNAAGPDAFDCSGLTMAAYAEIGISLPHYSGAQVQYGTAVDWTTQAIRPGDLVFLESAPGTGLINHVGIATSATQWVQAPRSGDVVRMGTIPMYRVVAVRRLVSGS